jgi:hypothetical protein
MTAHDDKIRSLALTVMESGLPAVERRYLLGILADSIDRDTQEPHPVRCECSDCRDARNDALAQSLDDEGRV